VNGRRRSETPEMTIFSETRGVPRRPPGHDATAATSERTSSAIDLPRGCGARATGPSRPSRRLGLVGLSVLALAACDPYIQGNGVLHEDDRSGSLGPFLGVHVGEGIAATITAGTADQSVLVSGDANVVSYIRTEVRPEAVRGASIDVLHVFVDAPAGGYTSTYPLRATIRVPEIRFGFAQGDRSQIDLRDAVAAELVLEARDSAEILVRGVGGPALHATLVDADVDAGGYVVDTADVMLTGASRLEVHADVEVTGEAWGASEVDNQLGDGACNVALHDAAILLCG